MTPDDALERWLATSEAPDAALYRAAIDAERERERSCADCDGRCECVCGDGGPRGSA